MSLAERLTEYVSAAFSGLWIESHEHDDAIREIARLCAEKNWRLATWDIEQGLKIPGQKTSADAGANDPLAAIRAINALAGENSSAILVLDQFSPFPLQPRGRAGPRPADRSRQAEPHLHGGSVSDRVHPRRIGEALRRARTRASQPAADRRDRSGRGGRKTANCRTARNWTACWMPPRG